jgi:hypothetical protein
MGAEKPGRHRSDQPKSQAGKAAALRARLTGVVSMKLAHILIVSALAFLSQAWLVCPLDAQDKPAIVHTFEQAQTAGSDGREWDKSFPGAMTVDAVHRTVLLRFPSTAEAIKARLDAGLSIEKVELVLDFDGTEILPSGDNIKRESSTMARCCLGNAPALDCR